MEYMMNLRPYAPNFEIDAVYACASLHSTFMMLRCLLRPYKYSLRLI